MQHRDAKPRPSTFARNTAFLVEQCKDGQDSAFTQLYERHAAALRRSIARRLGCRLAQLVEVDDILQETFVAAWRYVESGQIAAFQTPGSFRNLLVKIALQKLADQARDLGRDRRDHRRTVTLTAQNAPAGSREATPSESARGVELQERVDAAMLELAERDRLVLDCRDNLGMSYEEIGAELGCRPANAKLRHFRAKERLQKLLDARGG